MKHESLSLYFELAEGQKADLEIISSAAIAWVEGLRAVAQAYAPDSDVKVELVDADEGSLIVNTLLDWFDRSVGSGLERLKDGYDQLPRGRKLALGLAFFLVFTGYPTYQAYFGDDMSEEERELLQQIIDQTQSEPKVDTARRKFFRTLERDPSVKAVGLKEGPKGPPLLLIDADQFPIAAGLWREPEEDEKERVITQVLDVVLVKPALVHTPRSWTFKPDGLPEFDAVMKDALVLRAIQESGFPETLREGIPMTIRIEVREKLVDGGWRAVRGGRTVSRVLSPKLS